MPLADPETVQAMAVAQQEFESLYITSSEICEELGVARSVLMKARERGMLPGAIFIRSAKFYIWKRADVKQYMDAWALTLKVRRSGAA